MAVLVLAAKVYTVLLCATPDSGTEEKTKQNVQLMAAKPRRRSSFIKELIDGDSTSTSQLKGITEDQSQISSTFKATTTLMPNK